MRINIMGYNIKMNSLVRILGLAVAVASLTADKAYGQTVAKETLKSNANITASVAAPAIQATPAPLFTSYRSITIGVPSDEVKEKLGKPKVADKDGFFYQISDDEFA